MTINKSQGQTFKGKVGIYLPTPVFAHGQLYVALSRAMGRSSVKFLIIQVLGQQRLWTTRQGKPAAFTINAVDPNVL